MDNKTLPFVFLFRKYLRFRCWTNHFSYWKRVASRLFLFAFTAHQLGILYFYNRPVRQDRMGRDIVFFPGCIVPYSYYNSRSLFSIKNEIPRATSLLYHYLSSRKDYDQQHGKSRNGIFWTSNNMYSTVCDMDASIYSAGTIPVLSRKNPEGLFHHTQRNGVSVLDSLFIHDQSCLR